MKTRTLIFLLSSIYETKGTILHFLRDLVEALSKEDIIGSLEKISFDPAKQEKISKKDIGILKKCWIWLRKYSEMKPGFFGFNLKLDELIDNYIFKLKQ